MTDWSIRTQIGGLSDDSFSAETEWDLSGRCAIIKLAPKLEDWELTKRMLNQIAYHECVHVAHAPISRLIRSRYITEREITDAKEAFVRRLENAHL